MSVKIFLAWLAISHNLCNKKIICTTTRLFRIAKTCFGENNLTFVRRSLRHEKGLCEFDPLPASENNCTFAHCREELEEWINRRQYIINRIRKAQDDRLINAEADVDNLISQQAPQS